MKSKKIYISILLLFCSVFFFACNSKNVEVETINFRFEGGESNIVLQVGESYTPTVIINPSDASDKSYEIISDNTEVLSIVNGKSFLANAEGSAYVRVVSSSNPTKMGGVAVKVIKTSKKLATPTVRYDAEAQKFIVNGIESSLPADEQVAVAGYSLKVNGQVINLHGVKEYTLKDLDAFLKTKGASAFDVALSVSVCANSPTYTDAYKDSDYSLPITIFQASPVTGLAVKNGVFSFERTSAENYIVKIDDAVVEGRREEDNTLDLTIMDAAFAGKQITLSVIAKAEEEGAGYFNSVATSIVVDVLPACEVEMNGTTISWQPIEKVSKYVLNIFDGENVYVENKEVSATSLDISTLQNYNVFVNSANGYTIDVEPILKGDNLAKSTAKSNVVKFNRLASPVLTCEDGKIKWEAVYWEDETDETQYQIDFTVEGTTTHTHKVTTELSVDILDFVVSTAQAATYSFDVKAICTKKGGVNYLPSNSTNIKVNQLEAVAGEIENRTLKFGTVVGDKYLVKFNHIGTDGTEEYFDEFVATSETYDLSLNAYVFAAGENTITLQHLADEEALVPELDSLESTVKFVQLEKIESIAISNSKASVTLSTINKNPHAVIKLNVLSTDAGTVDYTVTGTSATLNSTNADGENYLPAGNYKVTVKVDSNNSYVFAYCENGEVKVTAEKEFAVLPATTAEFEDSTKATIKIMAVENATGYKVISTTSKNINKTAEDFETYTFDSLTDGNSINFTLQTIGDGASYLSSVASTEYTISKLQKVVLSFDNRDNVMKADNLATDYLFTYQHESAEEATTLANYGFGTESLTDKLAVGLTTFSIYNKVDSADVTETNFVVDS
ncbi:MAG: hypothetical protein MJ149_01820, partial [Clostridia bacterium]|nr:hypothetical protein [Clostridia bacterium]